MYDFSLLEVNRYGQILHLSTCLLDSVVVCIIILYNVLLFIILFIHRPIKNILGFSRETLIAVIANIEGRECLRRFNRMGKPEHPHASTSDDVECYFSMMRDAFGQSFTAKQVQYGFRNVTLEFVKRLNPDLPFYYHTSSHTRYSEGPLPDFNQASAKLKRKGRRLPTNYGA